MDQQFNNLDKQVALMNQELKALCDKVSEGFELNSEEHSRLVELFEKALAQKAGLWVEKVIVGAASVIGVAFLGALISLIWIK